MDYLADIRRFVAWKGPKLTDEKLVVLDQDTRSFYSTGKKPLSILEDLGYLAKVPETEIYDSVEDILKFFLNRNSRVVYRYSVLRDLPYWTCDLVYRGEIYGASLL